MQLEELKTKQSYLLLEHERFSREYEAAMERSRLYDKDMLESNEKTTEITYQLSEVDLKEKELNKVKESIVNFENVISQKVTELQEQEKELKESVEKIRALEAEANLKSEEVTTMNEEVMSKYKIIENL